MCACACVAVFVYQCVLLLLAMLLLLLLLLCWMSIFVCTLVCTSCACVLSFRLGSPYSIKMLYTTVLSISTFNTPRTESEMKNKTEKKKEKNVIKLDLSCYNMVIYSTSTIKCWQFIFVLLRLSTVSCLFFFFLIFQII